MFIVKVRCDLDECNPDNGYDINDTVNKTFICNDNVCDIPSCIIDSDPEYCDNVSEYYDYRSLTKDINHNKCRLENNVNIYVIDRKYSYRINKKYSKKYGKRRKINNHKTI